MSIYQRISRSMGPRFLPAVVLLGGLSLATACAEIKQSDMIPGFDIITGDSVVDLRGQAGQGDPVAMATLGERYETGDGVPLDPDEALDWYRQAAAAGDPLAQYRLGEMYLNGAIKPANHRRAAELFLRAAARGHAAAQASLAYLYETGQGLPQDYRRAAEFYALAALQAGRADPALKSAEAIGRPLVGEVPPDLRWSRRGARLAVASAQFDLARAHEVGDGVRPDLALADRWYREAAEHGHDRAAGALARLHADGSANTPAAVQTAAATPEAAPQMAPLPAPSPEPMAAITPPGSETYLVHLASYRDVSEADTGWGELMSQHGDLMNGLHLAINRVDVPDKGTFFRVQAGELADLSAATALCDQLSARGAYCRPVIAQ